METKNNGIGIGFWRRVAALWIDGFVIYSITKFIIVLLSIIDFRISFGTLFIITGAIYSTIMLTGQRQTVGKMLMQIMVVSRTNAPIDFRNILLREVFGKWGITMAMPMFLGFLLVGNNWLPTVFDILIMLPVIALCIIYFLFTNHMWYEQLSGLTVKRNLPLKQVRIGFYALLAAAVLGIGTTVTEYLVKGRIPCRMAAFQSNESSKPYVKFLKTQNTNPVDYVIGLFDKYDVVVLCERTHPELTQWDFIYDIVRDPRFIDKVGRIFTEYGHVGMQNYLDKFMSTDSLNESEIRNHALHIMRNMPVWPAWTNYNLYCYLGRLYRLNQTLPVEKRIQHYLTDAALNWDTITTTDKYREYQRIYLWNRDERMANTIIKKMDSLSRTSSKPPKCLVIMNYRHAMDFTDRLPNMNRQNTYEFLKDSFGNRAANVFINSRFMISIPVAGGAWEAAFENNGNKPLGFDFQGSPFGTCYFDLFPFGKLFSFIKKNNSPVANGSLRYRDVFTGFVFTHPVKDQVLQGMTPGFFDGFEEEYLRRSVSLGDEYNKNAIQTIQYMKSGSNIEIRKHSEFLFESIIELFFYAFSAIGLVIGIIAFMLRGYKKIIDMSVDIKSESKIWAVYFIAIICSVYLHELGHCVPAWLAGLRAIPTPAKEYISGSIPLDLKQYISLGGIVGSVLFFILAATLYLFKTYKYRSALLAGALANPGIYVFRFFLVGRGHDATEFQEAQFALGQSYSGHFLDWFFLVLLICGAIIWILKSKLQHNIIGRLLVGFIVTLIFLIALQRINNAIFDPIFLSNSI